MLKTISVLIPTIGREKEPLHTVQALLKQTRVPDEIIIIDQNGDRFPFLDHYFATIPIVRHIKTLTPGVVPNYNLALSKAQCDIVLYIDDDVIPDSKLVQNHLRNYESTDKELGTLAGVAGRVECLSGDRDPNNMHKVGHYDRWSGKLVGNFNATRRQKVNLAQGANMSFDRRVLSSIGGFDAGFEGNGYFFESDGALRLIAAGYSIVFDPDASLIHLQAPTGGARINNKAQHTFYFIRNGIRLFRRHSPTLAFPHCYARICLYFVAKALYNGNWNIFWRGFLAFFQGFMQPMNIVGNVRNIDD